MSVPLESGKPDARPATAEAAAATARPPARIAFLITELDPGGAERALVQLVTRLDRDRWEPVVFCLAGKGPLAGELEQAGVRVECFGTQSVFSIGVLPRLAAALRRERPALLQTWLYHANIVGRLAGRKAGVPRIVSGIRVAEKRSRLRLWIDRLTEGMVDRHVCVSRGVAEFSIGQGGLPREKVTVIPNGVDVARFSGASPCDLSEFGIPTDVTTVLFVGRLDPQKRPDLLLDAVAPLLRTRPDTHILFVGDGPLRTPLMQRAREAPELAARVHFAGWRPDVPELMRSAQILACPSAWEGMANVVLEAMAAGLPVVATDVEGMRDVIADGETGCLAAPGDPNALRIALEGLLASPDHARRMAEAAQDKVSKSFTVDSMTAAYDTLYRNLIAKVRSVGDRTDPVTGF